MKNPELNAQDAAALTTGASLATADATIALG